MPRPSIHPTVLISRLLPRANLRYLTTTAPKQSVLFNLNGLAGSREAQYLSRERNMPRTDYSSNTQLIRSSEVDALGPEAIGALGGMKPNVNNNKKPREKNNRYVDTEGLVLRAQQMKAEAMDRFKENFQEKTKHRDEERKAREVYRAEPLKTNAQGFKKIELESEVFALRQRVQALEREDAANRNLKRILSMLITGFASYFLTRYLLSESLERRTLPEKMKQPEVTQALMTQTEAKPIDAKSAAKNPDVVEEKGLSWFWAQSRPTKG